MSKEVFYLVVTTTMCVIATDECVGPFPSSGTVCRFLDDHCLWPKFGTSRLKFTDPMKWSGEIVVPENWVHPKDRG